MSIKNSLITLLIIFALNNTVSAQFSCASAIPMTNGYTSTSITSPGVGGTQDWVTSASAGCGTASNGGFVYSDVYLFSYTTGAVAGESFYFTINHNSSVVGEHSIGIWSGCTGGVLSGCVESTYKFKDVVGVCAQNLAANTTYYIGVGKEWYSLDGTNLNFSVVDFTVETSTTIPNDECITAPNMTISAPYSGSTRCSYTPSSGSPSGCGSIENDAWVSFIADSNTVIINYEVSNCTNGNGVQLSAWSGNCGSLSMISGSCLNYAGNNSTGTWTFTGLTVGNKYYIRADGYAGDLCSYSFTPIGGVLPITLTQFTGEELSNGYNKIKWSTASEINNAYFDLEKSHDGIHFETATTQNGAGNSNNTLHYLALDFPEQSTTYYRLKQVDYNGKFTYSDLISIENTMNQPKIYPNPSNDGNINISQLSGVERVQIIDVQGRIVRDILNPNATTLSLDLSALEKGLYYVVITNQSNALTEKLLLH